MGNLFAHDRGDTRNIWVIGPNGLEEITPAEDTTTAACELAKALGHRFYLRRSPRGDVYGWVAYSVRPGDSKDRWFPTQDSAVMYAAMKGAM